MPRPFRTEATLEIFTQRMRKARRPPTCRNGEQEVAASDLSRHVEIAEGRRVFDIDHHARQMRGPGKLTRTRLVQTSDKEDMQTGDFGRIGKRIRIDKG